MDFGDTNHSSLPHLEWMGWKRKCQIQTRACTYTCDCVHTAISCCRRWKADEQLSLIREYSSLFYYMLMAAHRTEYKPDFLEIGVIFKLIMAFLQFCLMAVNVWDWRQCWAILFCIAPELPVLFKLLWYWRQCWAILFSIAPELTFSFIQIAASY